MRAAATRAGITRRLRARRTARIVAGPPRSDRRPAATSPIMMLPLHDRLRTAVRAALADPLRPRRRRHRRPARDRRPTAPWATSGRRWPSSWPARCARRPRAIAQELAGGTRRRSTACSRVDAAAQRLPQRLPRSAGVPARPARRRRRRPAPTAPTRPSSSTRPSTRTRPRTSATCATPASATPWCGRCASAAAPVEVQNYIDDTGVQVADVVVGFRHLEGLDLDDVRGIADTTRFDYYCWDLYARVTEWYEADPARLAIRAATLHEIEHGDDPTAAIGAFVAERIVRTHLVDDGPSRASTTTCSPGRATSCACASGPGPSNGCRPAGRRLPAARRQAGRLLGDAHRDGRRRRRPATAPPTASRRATPSSARR